MGTMSDMLSRINQAPVASTRTINTAQTTPSAVISTSKGVSLADLLADGIPAAYIEQQMHVGVKLSQMPQAWKAFQERNAKSTVPVRSAPVTVAMPITPAVPLTDEKRAELLAENEALKAESEMLKAQRREEAAKRKLSLKVSEKGAVSVYGLGRFPVTLYAEQWERLVKEVPALVAFMRANVERLSVKE